MSLAMKKQAFQTFELLPEREQYLVLELMQRLCPDDIATPDDIANHNEAMEEYRQGKTIKFEDIAW
ncbi:MAG: hypothetical protein FWC08_13595 [Defluviitaleaceae bacterium]|nr:hypothetical protein [Defluviitaleaceae bacterium]